MNSLEEHIRGIANLLANIKSTNNEEAISNGLKQCTKAVWRINRQLKTAKSLGRKQKLITARANVKSYRNQLKAHRKHGAGISGRRETASNRVRWDDMETAFKSRIRTGVISNLKHKDPRNFLKDCFMLFKRRITNILKKEESVKVNTVFAGEFEKWTADKVLREIKYFTTPNASIFLDTDLISWFNEKVLESTLTQLEEFQERESGWALKAIINLSIHINKFTPQLGSSYIELLSAIKMKHACINVKNEDELCFAWSVVSALHPVKKDPQRPSKYPHPSSVLKLEGLDFPMTIRQVPKFERQNQISVNVYILKKIKDRMNTYLIYLTKNKQDKHVDLLMIQNIYYDEDNEEDIDTNPVLYHYCWIKDLSRLVSNQLSKMHSKKYFCDRCLHYFYCKDKLDMHYEECKNMNDCRVRMPKENMKNIKFKNYKNKEAVPFIIYADLESLLKPIEQHNKYQEHTPSSVGYYMKCRYDNSLSFYKSHVGPDCMKWFSEELQQLAEDLETVFLCPLPMNPLTREEQISFSSATVCHVCEKLFTVEQKKVRDHCHLTGKFRGAAHEDCNINYQDTHIVPVVFHNLSGYDAHFIIKSIAKDVNGHVDLLPINKEKYISFTKSIPENLIKFRFIDSFRFMAGSLDSLSANLDEFPILKSIFTDVSEEKLKLLTKKGVFPYDFIDSIEKFEYKQLPPKEAFYNKLEEREIYEKEYIHAQNVWNNFNCKTLGEYSDLYMKTDILLLADVFEAFRASCLKTYQLDPAHYYTLPGYTWDCMLKYTGIELELLTDIDMLMFVEKGVRGGLSQCSKRHATANNKYMSTYNDNVPDTYLSYFDVNNQYGWAMSQPLPYKSFKWVDTEEMDILEIPENSSQGYILEVDLEYPESLHDIHKDIPFCPEHVSRQNKQKKLMATLHNKEKYVIHYRALQQALKNGLKIKKIHRVLAFQQAAWLKSYIDLNTKLRSQAKNSFEKDLFKLLNNAVFGKTMENVRKHSIVKLISKWSGRYGTEALISKPEFKSSLICDENLVVIEMNKTEIFFNKPIYVGMAILDLAKTTIYNFHYEYMIPHFGSDCTVLYTDTDSLIYEIRNHNIYETIRRDCYTHFDTSDYPPNNVYNIPQVNKKILGMMKDECNGVVLTDFVGLRSKMYALKVLRTQEDMEKEIAKLDRNGFTGDEIADMMKNDGIIKKIKGVKKCVVKRKITFEDYIGCLEDNNEKSVSQNLIKSEKHDVYSLTQEKIALSPYDDKRHLVPKSHDTLPWGHYSLMQ